MNTHTKTRCSWCDKENGVHVEGVSHGICEHHRAQVLAEYGVSDAGLRVERNDVLEDLERSQRVMERVNRTLKHDLAVIGVGALGGAMVLGFAWLLWLAL